MEFLPLFLLTLVFLVYLFFSHQNSNNNSGNTSYSRGQFYAMRLAPQQDLIPSILQFCKEHQLQAVGIVTCVGSFTNVSLRYANNPNFNALSGHFEIVSLVGTIDRDNIPHIHVSVGTKNGDTISGHLGQIGNLVYTTAEIILVELADYTFTREYDPQSTFNELVVKKRQS